MKKFQFYWIALKNNLRRMPGIFILLISAVSFTFIFSGLLMRVAYTYTDDGKGPLNAEALSFLFGNIAIVGIAVINMLYIFAYYTKKSQKRITTYFMLGARKRDVLTEMALENLLIFIIGLGLGVGLDSVIHSFVELVNRHFYLNGWIFASCCLWTLLPPLCVYVITAIFYVKVPGAVRFSARRERGALI